MPSRTNFLPRFLAGALVVSVPVVSACGARIVPLGSTGATSDTLTIDPPSNLPGPKATISACSTGYAHPNICCDGPTLDSTAKGTCGTWTLDPFHFCDPGWTTYPNAFECCALSDPTDCAPPPAEAGTTVSSPPAYGCGFQCPIGTFWDPDPGAQCCAARDLVTALIACVITPPPTAISTPACSGTNLPVTTDAGSGPKDGGATLDANVDEAGIEEGGTVLPSCDAGATVPYPPGYDGGSASLCAPCPTGWSADANDPLLCCRESQSSGVRECFSQASGSSIGSGPTTGDDDGGVTDSDAGEGGFAVPPDTDASDPPSGSFCTASLSDSCSCQLASGGHTYELECSAPDSKGQTTCACSEDGAVTTQFTTAHPECADTTYASGDYLNVCGFPEP